MSPFAEIFQYGIKISSSETIPVQPVMRALTVKNNEFVSEGKYELQILAASENGKVSTFSIDVNGENNIAEVHGKSIFSTIIEQKQTGLMSLVIESTSGNVIVCGMILKPI